jgi:hypothetical protein
MSAGRSATGHLFSAAFWVLTLVELQAAQPPTPHIGYVYPAGGQQSSTFQVVVGGQRLIDPKEAMISGEGVQARVVEYNRPMTQKEFNDLRDELRALQEKRRAWFRKSQESTNRWSTVDDKRFAEIKGKILKNAPNRDGNPAIAENVILQITLATNAEFGQHELRIRAANGLSNPLNFFVDNLPEFTGRAEKAANPELERFRRFLGDDATNASGMSEMRVTFPAVVNGQIMAGEVDRVHFVARKGQHLLAVVSARKLMPYLADAVPGWFQATLGLTDAKGRQIAYNDDFRFDPDPVLYCEIPHDGEYILEIKDAIYRGREDFVYRIMVGELPFITSVFPLGGKAGEKTTVALTGWNLPVSKLRIDATNESSAILPVCLNENGRISNVVPFATDSLRECLDWGTNYTQSTAQAVAMPLIINGRIERPGACKFYRFEGRAGQEVVAEVRARRLGSPLDSVLKLIDSNGKQLAFNDDWEDKACGLETHHADSYLRTRLPSDGTYFVGLGDAQHKGGDEYAYRLRLSEPRPDFELLVTPSSINGRAGASIPLTVYALRRDGFTNEIQVRLKDAPSGCALNANRIPAGQDELRVTLQVPPRLANELTRMTIEGRAVIVGREVVHAAVPADEMMQAFFYKHLVAAKELQLAISGRAANRR